MVQTALHIRVGELFQLISHRLDGANGFKAAARIVGMLLDMLVDQSIQQRITLAI